MESVFDIVVGGWIGQLKFFKRNAIKDAFLIIFQNFHNSNFSSVLSKMFEDIFLEGLVDQMTHDFMRVLSLANFQLFQNTQRKHFSWSLHLLMSEILDCRAVALEKKAPFRKDFFGIFGTFEGPFLTEHSQNVSVTQSRSRL